MTVVEDVLAHYGTRGMKWGVRNDKPTSDFRLQAPPQSSLAIASSLPPSTKKSASEVAKLMGSRYGFQITEVRELGPGHPEYTPGDAGTIGFVESTPGKAGGVIYVKNFDMRQALAGAEKVGWFAPGCGTPEAFMTHEASHALLHAQQEYKQGFFGPKVVSGNMKARDKALKESMQAAKKDGIRPGIGGQNFAAHVSDYAKYAGVKEEIEAELFSQYHWGSNPPRFVKVWGQTLHKELGVDPTPFRKSVKNG